MILLKLSRLSNKEINMINATRKNILDILKFKPEELIKKIGLELHTLCSLSVPIHGDPILKVTVLSKLEHDVSQIVVDYDNNTFIIPVQVVIGQKIVPL